MATIAEILESKVDWQRIWKQRSDYADIMLCAYNHEKTCEGECPGEEYCHKLKKFLRLTDSSSREIENVQSA